MLEIDSDEESGRPFWLWRLLVGANRQGRGCGRRAGNTSGTSLASQGWSRQNRLAASFAPSE